MCPLDFRSAFEFLYFSFKEDEDPAKPCIGLNRIE